MSGGWHSFKAAIAFLGAAMFFIASIWEACQARHYQVIGLPMPNGKGGFMTFRDGYLIAVVFLGFSLVWFLSGRRFLRNKPS